MQQFAHSAVASPRKQTRDAGGLKLRTNAGEIVLLRKQRSHANFMAGALMVNGETFDEDFWHGQPRCVNQLKNSQDLSLWITALFAQRMDTPKPCTGPHRLRHPFLCVFGASLRKARPSPRTATVPLRSHCRPDKLHPRPSAFTPTPRFERLQNERQRPF